MSRRNPVCYVGSMLLNCQRHYRSQPTHGIGRYRHLLLPEVPKRRRERMQMKEIDPGTEHKYGVLNIVMTGYDMTLVEHYAQYIHRLCNRLSVKVEESYAMPTKTTEVMLAQEQGAKMHLDAVLTTHQRVVQISSLSATFAPILLEIIQNNQPEGLHLLVKELFEAKQILEEPKSSAKILDFAETSPYLRKLKALAASVLDNDLTHIHKIIRNTVLLAHVLLKQTRVAQEHAYRDRFQDSPEGSSRT